MKRKRSDLNLKQRKFIAEYMKDGNGKQAAIRAGYAANSAQQQASDLLLNPFVKAAVGGRIEKIEEKAIVDAAFVLSSLKEIAARCMQKSPVMVREGQEMVQKTDANGEGVWEFDSSGANRSIELLGKYLKLFTDKIEHDVSKSLEKILAESIKPE